jgi:predicted nucleotidyltransferase
MREDLFTLTELPDGTEVYVFGSYLDTVEPEDIDILVVYDEHACHPKNAFVTYKLLLQQIENILSYKVDLTLLTKKEERSLRFKDRVKCLPIKEILDKKFTA